MTLDEQIAQAERDAEEAAKRLAELKETRVSARPFGIASVPGSSGDLRLCSWLRLVPAVGSGRWQSHSVLNAGSSEEAESALIELRDALCKMTNVEVLLISGDIDALTPQDARRRITVVELTDWFHPLLRVLDEVPEDCRSLLLKTLPHLVAVMRKGAEKYPDQANQWFRVPGDFHADRAAQHGLASRCSKDDDGELHRAHQAVRVLMALGKELGL